LIVSGNGIVILNDTYSSILRRLSKGAKHTSSLAAESGTLNLIDPMSHDIYTCYMSCSYMRILLPVSEAELYYDHQKLKLCPKT